jgi:hypothetical protein
VRELLFAGGGTIAFKTAETGAGLLGQGLDLVILDEAALIREEAWQRDLRPALSDRQGRALFISTPRGQNWFWHAWLRGQDPEQTDWQSWRFPTSANPRIAASEIEEARGLLPSRIFEQEYLAEFLADGGAVFRNVAACATVPEGLPPHPARRYTMGVDWGRSDDFTALAVLDTEYRQIVHIERFNQIGWTLQRGRLAVLAAKWKPETILAEENSMGGPNIEALQREGLPVRPFMTTPASKGPLIEALALAFEQERIGILNDPVLVGELQAYSMERLPSGVFRYSAPAGMHDDTVIATALAWHAGTHRRGGRMVR